MIIKRKWGPPQSIKVLILQRFVTLKSDTITIIRNENSQISSSGYHTFFTGQ